MELNEKSEKNTQEVDENYKSESFTKMMHFCLDIDIRGEELFTNLGALHNKLHVYEIEILFFALRTSIGLVTIGPCDGDGVFDINAENHGLRKKRLFFIVVYGPAYKDQKQSLLDELHGWWLEKVFEGDTIPAFDISIVSLFRLLELHDFFPSIFQVFKERQIFIYALPNFQMLTSFFNGIATEYFVLTGSFPTVTANVLLQAVELLSIFGDWEITTQAVTIDAIHTGHFVNLFFQVL
ncbi:hypothetical protein ACJX0J_029682 [Zea mays]